MAMWRGGGGILRAASRLGPAGVDIKRPLLCRGNHDIVKEKFIEKIEIFYKLFREFKKFRVILDPDDPQVVKEFCNNIWKARENVGLPPPDQQLTDMLTGLATKSRNVREFYIKLGRYQASKKIEDVEGNKAMLGVVNEVEKKIGKPLTFDNKEGMKLFDELSGSALKSMGTHEEKLPEYCEELNLQIAKAWLTWMRDEAVATFEKHMKGERMEDLGINLRDVDLRNFIQLPEDRKAPEPAPAAS